MYDKSDENMSFSFWYSIEMVADELRLKKYLILEIFNDLKLILVLFYTKNVKTLYFI